MRYRLIAQHSHQHAVVLGAGLDGLLAARVLTEHFPQVTLVTDDKLPDEPTPPLTIEQAVPSHLLSVQGQRNLERLFPGLMTELLAAGAPTIDWAADAPMRLPGGWGPRFRSGLVTRSVTPNLLAHIIRQRLVAYGRGSVQFVDGQTDPDAMRQATNTLAADLMVDASGQPAQTAHWLNQLGYDEPAQTIVSARVGIAARLYRQPRAFNPGWKAVLIVPHDDQRGGLLVPVEDNGWLVMLIGCDGDYPPADDTGFAAFAPDLLREALSLARPLTPVYSSQDTANRRGHYEHMSRWPDHFITTSAMTYNPAYGLGLTAATLAALTLRETLDEQRKRHPDGKLTGLGLRFQKRLAKANDPLWRMVTACDSRWSTTPPDHLTRFTQWYGGHLISAACHDSQLYQTLIETAGLVQSPHSLLNPALARQVMNGRKPSPSLPVAAAPPDFQPERDHNART